MYVKYIFLQVLSLLSENAVYLDNISNLFFIDNTQNIYNIEYNNFDLDYENTGTLQSSPLIIFMKNNKFYYNIFDNKSLMEPIKTSEFFDIQPDRVIFRLRYYNQVFTPLSGQNQILSNDKKIYGLDNINLYINHLNKIV